MTNSELGVARTGAGRRLAPWRLFARNADGATAIEFALLALPFLLTLFAILEFGIALTVQQMLTNATDDVARQVRTGQVTSLTTSQLNKAVCDRIEWFVGTGCTGLRVDLRTYASFQAASQQKIYKADASNVALEVQGGKGLALKSEIGGAGAKQTLRTFYYWPIITGIMQSSLAPDGSGKMLLSAAQTWQNELY